MNVTLVYNDTSGSALSVKELRQRFNDAGILITRLISSDEALRQRLRAPIKNGETIAVIGGDGTISQVAGLMVGTQAVLLPLSGGTFNNFTKDLGSMQDLDAALAQAKKGVVRSIDVVQVNDFVFINNSSIGVYPQSLYYRQMHEPRYGKWAAMAIGVIKSVATFRLLRIEVDGQRYQTPFVFVGNNRYHLSGNDFARRTKLDEGMLTVAIARAATRFGLLRIALFALLGKTQQLREVTLLFPEEISIKTRQRKVLVSRDGEYTMLSSPLRYKIKKKSLNVLV